MRDIREFFFSPYFQIDICQACNNILETIIAMIKKYRVIITILFWIFHEAAKFPRGAGNPRKEIGRLGTSSLSAYFLFNWKQSL